MRIALALSLVIAIGFSLSIIHASVPVLQPRTYEVIGRHAWPLGLDHGARLVSSELVGSGGRTIWRMTFQEPSGTVKIVSISTAALDVAGEYRVIELAR